MEAKLQTFPGEVPGEVSNGSSYILLVLLSSLRKATWISLDSVWEKFSSIMHTQRNYSVINDFYGKTKHFCFR